MNLCVGRPTATHRATSNPEVFDIFRSPQQHLAFGTGNHICIGIHLARMETAVVMNALLDQLPNVRLAPDAGDVFVEGMVFRAPKALPVVWDV